MRCVQHITILFKVTIRLPFHQDINQYTAHICHLKIMFGFYHSLKSTYAPTPLTIGQPNNYPNKYTLVVILQQ